MFHYEDSNKKITYYLATVLAVGFGTITIYQVTTNNITIALLVGSLTILFVCFLLSAIHKVRIDFTGLTKVWAFRNKTIHFPLNLITKIEYRKRVYGGFNRRSYLVFFLDNKKEIIPLMTPRTEHYELLRMIHNCGIEIDFIIMIGHYSRPATQNEIDNIFNY